jgi:hypothetical protein
LCPIRNIDFPVQLFGHSAEARNLSTRFAIARGYAKLNFTIRCVVQEPEEKAEEGCEAGGHNYAGDGDIMICQECGDASLSGLILARVYFGDILRVTHPFFVFCRTRGFVAGMSCAARFPRIFARFQPRKVHQSRTYRSGCCAEHATGQVPAFNAAGSLFQGSRAAVLVLL